MMNMKKVLSRYRDWDKAMRVTMSVIMALGFVFLAWHFGLFSGW